jgi:hypothetical protein
MAQLWTRVDSLARPVSTLEITGNETGARRIDVLSFDGASVLVRTTAMDGGVFLAIFKFATAGR